MSNLYFTKPIRPPRSMRAPKETTGHLMKIISTLSVSPDNADRDKEKKKLEKEFHDSDKKLNRLVEDHREDLSNVMQVFRKVHLNIGIAESKCQELKEILYRCKKLLHCKRYELKKLWLEAIEHKRILTMLNEIEALIGVPANLETLLKNKMHLEATELLVSSISLLEGSLEGVDALKELKSELFLKREEFHKILVLQLHTHLYLISSNYILKHFKGMSSSRQQKDHSSNSDRGISQDGYSTSWSHSSWNSSYWNATFWVDDETFKKVEVATGASICNLVNCVTWLHRIPETVEILKDGCQQELLAIAWRTSQQVAESTQNIEVSTQPKTVFGSSINKEQQYILLDLLKLVFEQFRFVLKNHMLLLKNLQQKAEKDDSNHYSYEIAEIWSKIQTALEIFVGEYVDIHNLANSAAPALVTSAADVSAFFLRKRSQRPKNYILFKYDRSSHAISLKTYLNEQREILKAKGEIDAFDSETKVFACPPSHKNITTIYRPLAKFIKDMEKALGMEPGLKNCPLYKFMTGCADVFTSHVTMESTDLIDNVVKGTESWKAVSDFEQLQYLGLTKSVLDSTVYIDGLMREYKELAYSLPKQCTFFIHLICSMLAHYRDYCQTSYSSLIQPPSEDKRIISSAWARDSDISRLLRSLPNYSNLKDTDNSDSEESPEEVRLRNKKESEILIANLSGDTFISQHEILADTRRLHNLGLLHESLDWLASRLLTLMESFPNKSNLLCDTSDADHDEFLGPISNTEVSALVTLQKEIENMADTCLLVLHLEVRVHCFYYLQPLAVQGCYATRLDSQEPDPEIVKLNSDLAKIDDLLQLVMGPAKTKYIFEGLGELISTILINSVSKIKRINENGVKKMIRNIHALQQNLTGITMFREVALDRARVYFDLLKESPEEILNFIVEQGPQFQELEYSSIFHLLQRSQPCSDTSAHMNMYLDRLHQILNEVAVSV